MAQVKLFAVPTTGAAKGVSGRAAQFTIGRAVVLEKVPAIIVRVRMNSRGLREFARYCQTHNLQTRECRVGALCGVPTVESLKEECSRNGSAQWEVLGDLQALTYLTGHTSVVEWQYIEETANATDCRASGSTPKK